MTTDEIAAVIAEQQEIVEGNRCPYCRAKWGGAITPTTCCPAMAQEFSRLEIGFWGTPEQQADLPMWGIRAWLVPVADEPITVTREGGG